MSIFSKKQKVNIDEFCHNYYEKQYLDADKELYKTIRDQIIEIDPSFRKISLKKFIDEIMILQFELFALAWLHKFGDKQAISQSVFTENYLHENKRDNIWENSEDYNQAIARSSTAGRSPEIGVDRMFIVMVDKTRADLFDKYYEEGLNAKCIARALNRLFSEEAWKRGITENFLMFTICDRLGFKNGEPNKEAQQHLSFTIRMIYDNAIKSLDKIKIKK